jgi:DNA polymerase-4
MRKIIHIDMDCFYAAIEIRDNPSLADKPVAVGGLVEERGVLCTCNYIARKFGVHSAMPTFQAKRLCPDLIVLPVSMSKYRQAADIIHQIFREYTALVEPLSLDEAYLDVSDSLLCQGSATLIAKEIREKIWDSVRLVASAGVSSNKFLAKIASGWKKPNSLYVIRPEDISDFLEHLPIKKLYGVGKVTAEKLHHLGINTCSDLQKHSLNELTQQFGKFGSQLYDQSRGIDDRPVEPNRVRKSLSVETTFEKNISLADGCSDILNQLYNELLNRVKKSAPDRVIKNQYVKVKYSNFKQSTLERSGNTFSISDYEAMLFLLSQRESMQVRLIGIGVHFVCDEQPEKFRQQSLL